MGWCLGIVCGLGLLGVDVGVLITLDVGCSLLYSFVLWTLAVGLR